MLLDWNSEVWEGSKHVNGRTIHNRPLNMEPVYHALAQKICNALFNNFNGLDSKIVFAGTTHDTNHLYYVVLPKLLPTAKMDELRAFVRGYIACSRSFS